MLHVTRDLVLPTTITGSYPGECSRLEKGQEKEAVVYWS